jgi:hypothetical protein
VSIVARAQLLLTKKLIRAVDLEMTSMGPVKRDVIGKTIGKSYIQIQRPKIAHQRIVIQLSDLHIGMNGSSVALQQAQLIVDGIEEQYSHFTKKPIVVVTGDLVDNYSTENLQNAANLLQQLANDGFTVLVVPGNHDYCEKFDVSNGISALQMAPIKKINDLLKAFANGMGYDPKMASGLNFTDDACNAFISYFGNYMMMGSEGVYQEDDWRKHGAKYNLKFILLDAQDHHSHIVGSSPSDFPATPDPTLPLLIHPRFYFHDNTRMGEFVDHYVEGYCLDYCGLRFDRGWLEDKDSWKQSDPYTSTKMGVNHFNHFVDGVQKHFSDDRSLLVVAIHYPVDDYSLTRTTQPDDIKKIGKHLVNARDLYDRLDKCNLVLSGHTHWRPGPDADHKEYNPYDNNQLVANFTTYSDKPLCCLEGSTFPDNKAGNWGLASGDVKVTLPSGKTVWMTGGDTLAKQACRQWVECTIDLNTGDITCVARNCPADRPSRG